MTVRKWSFLKSKLVKFLTLKRLSVLVKYEIKEENCFDWYTLLATVKIIVTT